MRKRFVVALFMVSALAGCAGEAQRQDLAVACALAECTCLSDSGSSYFERNFTDRTSETTEVLWTDRGNAYCPEGFSLRLIDEKDKQKKKTQYYTPT